MADPAAPGPGLMKGRSSASELTRLRRQQALSAAPTQRKHCLIKGCSKRHSTLIHVKETDTLAARWEIVELYELCTSCLLRHKGYCVIARKCKGCQDSLHNELLCNTAERNKLRHAEDLKKLQEEYEPKEEEFPDAHEEPALTTTDDVPAPAPEGIQTQNVQILQVDNPSVPFPDAPAPSEDLRTEPTIEEVHMNEAVENDAILNNNTPPENTPVIQVNYEAIVQEPRTISAYESAESSTSTSPSSSQTSTSSNSSKEERKKDRRSNITKIAERMSQLSATEE